MSSNVKNVFFGIDISIPFTGLRCIFFQKIWREKGKMATESSGLQRIPIGRLPTQMYDPKKSPWLVIGSLES